MHEEYPVAVVPMRIKYANQKSRTAAHNAVRSGTLIAESQGYEAKPTSEISFVDQAGVDAIAWAIQMAEKERNYAMAERLRSVWLRFT